MSDIPQAPNGAAKPAERRVRHGLIEDWRDAVGILILLTAAAFFGALTTRFWPDEDTPKIATDITARLDAIEARQSPSELANLKDRAAKFDTRLAAAEAATAAGGAGSALGAPAALEAAREQIEDLGARLTALEAKLATTPDDIKATHAALTAQTANVTGLTTRLDTFAERLTKLESSDLIEMARRASLASAIANLMRAAQGSAPFKAEFDVVASLLPDDPRLKDMAPLAAKGLPTAGTLIAQFGDKADATMDVERLAKAEDMWARLSANFMALVSSRKVGEVGDNTSEGRLARAELRLKAGDLGAAVRELAAIKGPAREPLKPWLADAAARVKLEAALADLNTRAIQALSGAAAPAAPVPQPPQTPAKP
jgi:hypothetical protein